MIRLACAIGLVLVIGMGAPSARSLCDDGGGELRCGNLVAKAALAAEGEAAERQYAPDRKVDILHVVIDVTPDFKARTVSGTTTIRFVPIAKPLVELQLSAVDLRVSSVMCSAPVAGYSVTDKGITITFDPPLSPGAETSLAIAYEAEPERGLYFRTPEIGYSEKDIHLWTQGETHGARHWFPNYDFPNERFTSEVICRVPKEMVVLSNGKLVSEEIDAGTRLKVVRWLQDKPHVNYLIALVAGKFRKIESRSRGVPLAFFTPPSDIDRAENSSKDTGDMLAFFEDEIGVPYPWDKYYQAVVYDFVAGGMENTSLTILNDRTLSTKDTENLDSSQGLVAHELVHQWFGDYVTCKDWSHVWLNEGFATYYTHLYDGHKNGRDSMLYGLYRSARGVLADRPTHKPIVHRVYTSGWEQFDYRTYAKGGWVLHMLRTQLGEELFRRCVKTYLDRYALSSVVTENLSSVFEEVTGRSFDRFFDQWVYHARHPDLAVTYSWSEKDKLAKVSVRQTHAISDEVVLFHFQTKVRFVVGDEVVDREIVIKEPQHDFYFPLETEPVIVRFDPEYGLLADVSFDKPTAMLYAQLDNRADVIGRLLAIESLKKKKDKNTVAKLKDVLNSDPFYGVRVEASEALREIRTDEAFEALTKSMDQPDARVRERVVTDICSFYRPEALRLTNQVLKKEKNPDIVARAINSLGRYHGDDTRQLVIQYLGSKSYRNTLADAAVQAIRMLDDSYFVPSLQRVLREREKDFTSGGYARALETLGRISRNEEDRAEVRDFLAGYVNHPKERVRAGAIEALGSLEDPKAIPIVETFEGDDPRDHVQRAAKEALDKLREQKPLVPREIIQLREVVEELKKEHEKIKHEFEDLKKRLDAKDEGKEGEKDESPATSRLGIGNGGSSTAFVVGAGLSGLAAVRQ